MSLVLVVVLIVGWIVSFFLLNVKILAVHLLLFGALTVLLLRFFHLGWRPFSWREPASEPLARQGRAKRRSIVPRRRSISSGFRTKSTPG
jgi:hypothetical protein